MGDVEPKAMILPIYCIIPPGTQLFTLKALAGK